MLVSEKIEQTFVPLLQHNVCITYNNKNIKTGKLLLVTHKSTNICLTLLLPNNTTKMYELPYPFDYEYVDNTTDKQITFNYCLSSICASQMLVYDFKDQLSSIPKKPHRFLDNHIHIKTID